MTSPYVAAIASPFIDSENYGHTFYGILNKDGQFWTPITFDSEEKAKWHIVDYWLTPQLIREFMATAKIVPVRIQLTALLEHPSHG